MAHYLTAIRNAIRQRARRQAGHKVVELAENRRLIRNIETKGESKIVDHLVVALSNAYDGLVDDLTEVHELVLQVTDLYNTGPIMRIVATRKDIVIQTVLQLAWGCTPTHVAELSRDDHVFIENAIGPHIMIVLSFAHLRFMELAEKRFAKKIAPTEDVSLRQLMYAMYRLSIFRHEKYDSILNSMVNKGMFINSPEKDRYFTRLIVTYIRPHPYINIYL